MAKAETDIVHRIMLATAKLAVTWKNVRGMFWTMDKKRKVRAGLCAPGSSDLIGFAKVRIREEHVGKILPILCVMEVKTETGVSTQKQRDFVGFVREQGGIAGIIRSPEEALRLLNGDYDKKSDFLS